MNRILDLQAIAQDSLTADDAVQSQSSCSWALCGVCSSTSDSGCSSDRTNPTITAV